MTSPEATVAASGIARATRRLDLPAPLGPTSATISPALSVNVALSTATRPVPARVPHGQIADLEHGAHPVADTRGPRTGVGVGQVRIARTVAAAPS